MGRYAIKVVALGRQVTGCVARVLSGQTEYLDVVASCEVRQFLRKLVARADL